MERHTETIIGSISGVSPTATASAKKKASFQSCFVKPLMRKTSGTMTAMKLHHEPGKAVEALVEARRRPLLVIELAMLPRYVCAPVATTTAVAVPLSTLVPMKHMFLSSVGEFAVSVPARGTSRREAIRR